LYKYTTLLSRDITALTTTDYIQRQVVHVSAPPTAQRHEAYLLVYFMLQIGQVPETSSSNETAAEK
jgi:hypothetical protein